MTRDRWSPFPLPDDLEVSVLCACGTRSSFLITSRSRHWVCVCGRGSVSDGVDGNLRHAGLCWVSVSTAAPSTGMTKRIHDVSYQETVLDMLRKMERDAIAARDESVRAAEDAVRALHLRTAWRHYAAAAASHLVAGEATRRALAVERLLRETRTTELPS